MNKANVSILKRLGSYFIDAILFLGLYFALFFLAGKPLITHMSQDSISLINRAYDSAVEELNSESYQGYEMIKHDGNYGINNLNYDKYKEYQLSIDNTKTEDDIQEMYMDSLSAIETKAKTYPIYMEGYKGFRTNYYLISFLALLVPSLILNLIIPLFNRSLATVGMLIFHQKLVESRDEDKSNKFKLVLRFAMEPVIDLILILILGWLFFLIPVLFSVILILSTKTRRSLLDGLTFTKVMPSDYNKKEIIEY